MYTHKDALIMKSSTTTNTPTDFRRSKMVLRSSSLKAPPCNVPHCTSKRKLRVESNVLIKLIADKLLRFHGFLHRHS